MSEKAERISNQSMDLGGFNKERLLEMFPIFRTEGGGVDFDRLKLALGESVEVGKEVFGMRWPGKADSIRLANTPSQLTLSPVEKESINFDTTQNLIIEADNLEGLKLLQKSYQGKVKMIYIDPPYNTGKEFVYSDKFSEGFKNYLQQTGQVDGEGNRLSTNSETDGRFHSNWMNMMRPRLYLAQNLMRDDAVIFVSIDDNEVHHLRILLNEIFGESNFVAELIWKSKSGGANDSAFFAVDHEYILCYGKDISKLQFGLDLGASVTTSYPYEDEVGKYGLERLDKQNLGYVPTLDFEIVSPDGVSHKVKQKNSSSPNARWRWSKETVKARYNELVFKEGNVYTKNYVKDGAVPRSLLTEDRFGRTRTGSTEVREMFGSSVFDNPKPSKLLEFLIGICSPVMNSSDIIMDFFAGSGTTAHGVMAKNASDSGNRRFILVQMPEQVDPESEAAKAGFDNIADITKERVRRAGKKIIEESDGKLKLKGEDALDFGFRVLKLNESNIEDWNSEEASKSPKDLLDALKTSRLKTGRSEQDVVFEVLVKYGIELTSSVEEQKVGKGSVWKIAGGELIVVVAPGLSNADLNAIVKMTPKVVVMLDEAFVPEALKTNARATFKDAKIELKTF
jgi:adenine-specific DNA-methyltransferase